MGISEAGRESQAGVNVSVEMIGNKIRRFSLSGTTKDNPSREDIREMLNSIYDATSGFFSAEASE